MALFQGSSITYDALSFALLLLFFSLLITYYFQEHKITLREIIFLFLVAFTQRLMKDGYFLLYFTVFFISPSKFENKSLYWGTMVSMLVAAFVPAHLWNAYLNLQHLPPEIPLEKDYLFSKSKSLDIYIHEPVRSIQLLAQNILVQSSEWIKGSIGRFGYSYIFLTDWVIYIQLIAMMFSVVAEKANGQLAWKFRAPVLVLVLGNCLAIIVMFQLVASPVGGYKIHGIQGRYFTPILPFLFAFLFYTPDTRFQKAWLNKAVLLYSSLILIYTIYFIHTQFYQIN
jgi:uncharacterized membrane protein